MSKQVKEMIVDEYKKRFADSDSAVLVDIRALDANQNSEFRGSLLKKDIKVTVVRNRLARTAFNETPLSAMDAILEGPSAVVYGAESVVDVAREIVDWAKKFRDKMEVKGAVLDGELFEGREGVDRLSKFPTRQEALAQVVQLVISPAGELVSAATSPGANIVSIVSEIEERLEKGETIEKA